MKDEHSCCVGTATPMWKCLSPAFFLLASRGRLLWLHKEAKFIRSLLEIYPSALFVYGLSKHLPDDFINSVTSLKSCLIQDDAHLCGIWQFLTHFHSSHEKLWFRKAKMVRPEMLKSRLEKDSPCFILMFITTLFQKRMLFIISEQFQIIKTIWW